MFTLTVTIGAMLKTGSGTKVHIRGLVNEQTTLFVCLV